MDDQIVSFSERSEKFFVVATVMPLWFYKLCNLLVFTELRRWVVGNKYSTDLGAIW